MRKKKKKGVCENDHVNWADKSFTGSMMMTIEKKGGGYYIRRRSSRIG